jgi:uncharacterized protein YkwD
VVCANANAVPTSENIPQIAAATLCLINQQRALSHEQALKDDANLDVAATEHSLDMVASNYFDHVRPTGSSPLDRIQASGYIPRGYAYELGENIAMGTLTLGTPAATVAAWMASPPHRAFATSLCAP